MDGRRRGRYGGFKEGDTNDRHLCSSWAIDDADGRIRGMDGGSSGSGGGGGGIDGGGANVLN